MNIIKIEMYHQPLIRIFSIGDDCHYAIRGDLRETHEYTKDFSDLGDLAASIVTDAVLWLTNDPRAEEGRR